MEEDRAITATAKGDHDAQSLTPKLLKAILPLRSSPESLPRPLCPRPAVDLDTPGTDIEIAKAPVKIVLDTNAVLALMKRDPGVM